MDPIDLAKSVKPITAYHGSPHEFDQFDTSKIGTGEGAQAYGHGLYFAGNEGVARSYRDALSNHDLLTLRDPKTNKIIYQGDSIPPHVLEASKYLESGRRSAGQFPHNTAYYATKGYESAGGSEQDVINAINELKDVKTNYEKNPGHMYEVNIAAHPDHMLDWDKPLSEQSEHVQNVMAPRLEKFRKLGANFNHDPSGAELYRAAHPTVQLDEDIDWNKGLAEQASKFLQRAGIHGVRYLDAGSRNAQGDPTHNYVVFDHNRVSVKRKYEQGGRIGHNQGPSLEDDPRFREYMSRILDPRNPEHFEAAKKIAENYGVNDLSYSGFKKHPILPSQVTTQIHDIPGAVPKPVNPMSWHDFYRIGKGGVLFTLGGDRSNLGRLTHINGVKLAWPIDLHAGTKYQREPNKNAVWANDKNAQKALLNNIKRINDKGQEAYGSFAPMGTGAIDSSKNMTDAMMSHIAASQIDKDAMREFDNLIRSGQHVYNSTPGKPAHKEKTRQKRLADMQEWPGLEDPWAARNFAFQKMSGQERSGMIKLLDRADLLNYGFPSVGNTRAAITDPELLHTSNNMTGGNIVRLSAEKHDPNDLSFIHSTYNTPTKGEYVGTVPFMPRHDVLPDFMQDQLMNPKYVNKSGPNKGEPLLVHSMSPNPMGRASIRGNTEMRQGIQPINERMLESIEQGQDRIKKYGFKSGGRTAYKKGGKVEGSIWHNKDVEYGAPTNSAIVQHVLAKIDAPLPAAILHQGSVTGRRH